jgi:hypothetical protein
VATITVTQPGTTVSVKNGDQVVIDIPGGGEVTVVAASPGVRNFQLTFTDDTVSDVVKVDLTSFQSDNLLIELRDYDQNDVISLDGAITGSISSNQSNDYDFTYLGVDNQIYGGQARLLDPGERDLNLEPPPIIIKGPTDPVICFGAGTAIDTDLGPKPVETLRPGDLVVTADHGLQPVRWTGSRRLTAAQLRAEPHLAPVLIRAGAMGEGRPCADLVVSPQHRIWVSDWRAQLLFGEPEVLVPAKALIDGVGIVAAPLSAVIYCHILFDRHEIVTSNGIRSESLFTGDMALGALGAQAAEALSAIRPVAGAAGMARPALRYRDALALAGVAA